MVRKLKKLEEENVTLRKKVQAFEEWMKVGMEIKEEFGKEEFKEKEENGIKKVEGKNFGWKKMNGRKELIGRENGGKVEN
jgi:hypothetical protein